VQTFGGGDRCASNMSIDRFQISRLSRVLKKPFPSSRRLIVFVIRSLCCRWKRVQYNRKIRHGAPLRPPSAFMPRRTVFVINFPRDHYYYDTTRRCDNKTFRSDRRGTHCCDDDDDENPEYPAHNIHNITLLLRLPTCIVCFKYISSK